MIYVISLLLVLKRHGIDVTQTIIGIAKDPLLLSVHQNGKLRLALFYQTFFECDIHLLVVFGSIDEGVLALLPFVGFVLLLF